MEYESYFLRGTYLEPFVFAFSTTLGRFSTDGAETTLVIGTAFDEARVVQVERISCLVPAGVGGRVHEVEV
jgi:hypothetical protein